jgi:2-amino-4-hydroxy-6-hydroxymethyldihydropteridine diphosphokinase
VTGVYVGLGSNVGDRREAIQWAVEALRQTIGVQVLAASSLIETEPVGGPPNQGRFLNGAVELETDLEPEALLDVLQEIEHRLGRTRTVRWGPRKIDLDLLLYGNRIVATGRLRVPHLRLRERRFVLEPLASIAPDAADPITGLTVRELLERCGEKNPSPFMGEGGP